MMGKYDHDKIFPSWIHSPESQYLEFVANELAEMNRLKRLELLRLRLPFQDSKISSWEKEIQDQTSPGGSE